MRGRLIIFHLTICFFYLLYRNIISWTSPKIVLIFLFIKFFVKWNFAFTLRNSGLAKTWSYDQPDHLLWPWSWPTVWHARILPLKHQCFVNNTIHARSTICCGQGGNWEKSKGRPAGISGHFKVVDPRMKKS